MSTSKSTTKAPATKIVARPEAKATVRKERAPKPGVPKATAKATAAATKRTVANGRKASDVVTLQVPKGAPATREQYDAIVLAAKSEHESYLRWRRDGQPGGAKAQPKRPHVDQLKDLKAEGVTRLGLPAETPKAKAPRKGASRPTGKIAEGKTSAGLNRLDDEATIKWIKGQDASLTVHALHRLFRDAGFGANGKRFARLVEQAR